MTLHVYADGAHILDGVNQLGPAKPGVVVLVDGVPRQWQPQWFEATGNCLIAEGGPGGLRLELRIRELEERQLEVVASVRNDGTAPMRLDRLVLLSTRHLLLGADSRRWRIWRNGYQSWSGTYTLGTDESDRDLPFTFARAGVTDARHRAPSRRGHVRSDSLTAICEPQSGEALAFGFTDLATAFGFVEIEAPNGELRQLSAWVDLDGVVLAPGARTPEFSLRLQFVSGSDCGWRALRAMAEVIGSSMNARGRDQHHPGGWCSWYYYFNRVREQDIHDNLKVLAADGRNGPEFGCEYVMVDDGHQSELGDWLITDTTKFPSGMAAVARRIGEAGFDAGIWWAPFLVAPEAEVAKLHPEWLVRDEHDKPIVGCSLNPWWGVTRKMGVLDTTCPEVLKHLENVARTIRFEWGYAIQKLDFLYAAALPGRRSDGSRARAGSLRLGLEAIRRGAGEDAFLLGCGCPLGPAIGVVDAMRIGADVTPYWTNFLARVVLRNVHGLATRHAILNTLTRAVLDRAWWLNDPDCLMVRDSETTLNEEEVRLLATVFGITDGMIVLSDRLDRLPPARRAMVARARALGGGTPEVVDLFAGPLPELIVNRGPTAISVAVLNLTDRRERRSLDLAAIGLDGPDGVLREYWTGEERPVRGGTVDLGELPPHSARVIRFEA